MKGAALRHVGLVSDYLLPVHVGTLGIKASEQIRKTFNIANEFTPEEEAAIIAENEWAEES